MANLGWHYLVELTGCDRQAINDSVLLRTTLLESLREAGAAIIGDVFHSFSPQGVTGIVAIAESHASVHTWPEHGYVAIDIFSCTRRINSELVVKAMAAVTRAEHVETRELLRGRAPSLSSVPSL